MEEFRIVGRVLHSPSLGGHWPPLEIFLLSPLTKSRGGIAPTLKVWLNFLFFFHKCKISVRGLYQISSTYNKELKLLSYFSYFWVLFDYCLTLCAYLPTFRASFSRFFIFCLIFICNYQSTCRSSFTYKNWKIFACGGPWYNLFSILFGWKVIVYRV